MATRKTKASVAPLGEPSSKLQDLFAKTVVPEPYPVTDTIIVAPLTKKTRQRLDELQNQRVVANFFLAEALRRTGEHAPSDVDIAELTKIVEDAEHEYNQLFFGDQLDAVLRFFADRPPAQWEAFTKDIRRQFYAEPGPDAGKCPHCGTVVDEEQAGKDGEPST